jgi:hypothetical protein
MRQKSRRSESHAKGAVGAERPLTRNQAKEAMARFNALTLDLLAVSRHLSQEEEARYEKRKLKKTNKIWLSYRIRPGYRHMESSMLTGSLEPRSRLGYGPKMPNGVRVSHHH